MHVQRHSKISVQTTMITDYILHSDEIGITFYLTLISE